MHELNVIALYQTTICMHASNAFIPAIPITGLCTALLYSFISINALQLSI